MWKENSKFSILWKKFTAFSEKISTAPKEGLQNIPLISADEWSPWISITQIPGGRIKVEQTGEASFRLTIKEVWDIDDGEYTCEVSNIHGKDTSTALLRVQGLIRLLNFFEWTEFSLLKHLLTLKILPTAKRIQKARCCATKSISPDSARLPSKLCSMVKKSKRVILISK